MLAFRNFLNGRHANMSFTIESEKQKDKNFPLLSAVNLPLVEFIYTLTVFYHLPTHPTHHVNPM